LSSTPNFAIRLAGVGKRYRVQQKATASAPDHFWAVRDISFDVPPGQSVGIIGHNGAGKSTLLKLLSSITTPTTGQITIRGRMAGLLEVGSGFHPELSGRENIFLSGTILGMRREEIHQKLESIIDFAEIRPFINLPVKRYSSGMYVRLGFSIAAHLEPHILLLDEVLAVGDSSFQQKCIDRVLSLKASGVTILFISHDLRAVERICERVLVLDHGKVIFDGPPGAAISAYQQSRGRSHGERRIAVDKPRIEIESIAFIGADGKPMDHAASGEPFRIDARFLAREPLENLTFDLFFNGSDSELKTVLSTRPKMVSVPAGHGRISFTCPSLGLAPDVYRIDSVVEQLGSPDPLEWLVGSGTLPVQSAQPVRGQFHQPAAWEIASI
jgi:ABC-type polysaccharide/polyol phosphate transport system ATPase subunit